MFGCPAFDKRAAQFEGLGSREAVEVADAGVSAVGEVREQCADTACQVEVHGRRLRLAARRIEQYERCTGRQVAKKLVVWRLDSLPRSLHHLLTLSPQFSVQRVALVSLTEQIDTRSASGKLIFHVLGALAEFERDLTRERVQAGLAAARARGSRMGRWPLLTPHQIEGLRRLYETRSLSVGEMARLYHVSRRTVQRYVYERGE